MKHLAIVCTHPIQYYSPIFQLLNKRGNIKIKVFYSGGNDNFNGFDKGFGKVVSWDIPLLDGFDYEFLKNTAKDPGTHHFNGIKNPSIIEAVNTFKPDAILIYGWAWKSHLKVINHFYKKIPLWFRGDSTLLNEKKDLKSLIKTYFLKNIYRKISKAFYVGINNKAYFLKFGIPEKKMIFAPHSIDNERFSKIEKSATIDYRKKLGIADETILILFAGKLEDIKNPELLLKAFLAITQKHLALVFVGTGPLETKLKLLTKMHEANNIYFVGFQNQSAMPIIYNSCDLVCLPSKSDSWGLAINEAMAAGKAVLVSNKVGCAPDLVKENVNGSVFNSENETDLRIKLESMCDKVKLQKFGLASSEIIKNYNFLNQVIAFENALK